MAVYDDEHSEKVPEPADEAATADGADDLAAQEDGSFFNPVDRESSGADSSKSLAKKEAAQPAASGGGGLYNSGGEGGKDAKSTLKGLLKKKWVIGLAAGGGVSIGGLIIIAILFLSLLKIPNLVEHITAYQFARVSRDIARNSRNVNATKIAIDSADDGTWSKLKAKYYDTKVGKAQTKVADKWNSYDKYRPQKVIDNMKRDDKLKYQYEPKGVLQRQRLTSILVGNEKIPVQDVSFTRGLIPGNQFRADSRLATQLRPALRTAMADGDIGVLTRTVALRKIRQQLGISLIAWHIDKLKGTTPEEARIRIEQENYKNVKGPVDPVNPASSDTAQKASKEGLDAEKATVADPKKLEEAIVQHPNEPVPDVVKILNDSFKESGFKKIGSSILGAINPIYGIAAPVCMIYEGSLVNSGHDINEADETSQRSYIALSAASSQIKDGYDANGQAVGAFSAKLGNELETTTPEMRASGKAVDTSKSTSNQASPSGQYSLADALLPQPFNSVFNDTTKACPILTSYWTAGIVGAINLVPLVLSGGSAGVVEGSADVAVQSVTSRIVSKLIATKSFAFSFGKKTAINVAAIGGATYLAKLYVLSHMGSAQTNPLASGKAYVENVDAGGNAHAQMIERTTLRGAPLTTTEVAYNNIQDQQYRSAQVSSQSPFQRYLAITNADSLANHLASSLAGQLNGSIGSTLVSRLSNLLNPAHTIGGFAAALSPGKAFADSTDTFNHGNVQFGDTAEESRLKENDPTYISTLENQRILDESGKEEEIAKKYGPCFDPNMGMGDLLTKETGQDGRDKHYIERNTKGEVSATEGLCSQRNLGPNNDEGYGDLVFRYRTAGGYDTAEAQLEEEAAPTSTDAPLDGSTPSNNGDGGLGISPDGFVFPQKTTQTAIKNHSPSVWCFEQQTNCHHDYNAADIFNATGTPVVAARAGTVKLAKNASTTGCSVGSYVSIKGIDGLSYYYAHMGMDTLKVKKGDTVTAGQELGNVGTNANAVCTQSHTHFDILPSSYDVRVGCAGAACKSYPFINVQPVLTQAFKGLPQ